MSAAPQSSEPGNTHEDAPGTPAKKGGNAATTDAESDEEEEDEPQLKYTKLTGSLSSVYRNGDTTSAFFVGGDKMVRLGSPLRQGE